MSPGQRDHRPTFEELARRAYAAACELERIRFWAGRTDLGEIEDQLADIGLGATALRVLSVAAKLERMDDENDAVSSSETS
jgi:hypothetical protein